MKMIKKIISFVAFAGLITGFVILVQPYILMWQRSISNKESIISFESAVECAKAEQKVTAAQAEEKITDAAKDRTEQKIFPELYEEMKMYNERIFEENQTDLRDAFSYTTGKFHFEHYGLTNDMTGYLTIEKLGIRLALYIGANYENLQKGAAVMYNTSAPIGGKNTNCVIAAHRSMGYFGEIEELTPGDIVRLTNFWEELTYRVEKIIVIDPFETDKIRIIPQKDMLTLLTCHPYWDNSKRYIVYCERVNHEEQTHSDDQTDSKTSKTEMTTPRLPDGEQYTTSAEMIHAEHIVRISGIILTIIFLILFIIMFVRSIVTHYRNKRV